ncbi:hypothetical protein H8R18_04260 [Nanchangia anserum]|uniref:hypothetical protein n=1 Tax=Nanchangia anserum TaxID=2692125 RepID=UPI001883646E|nr:hypothetical protein [Nanchangia anserum]QOX82508.1 hypothetical protein H8R18_04260 [Nanchangia anserum]
MKRVVGAGVTLVALGAIAWSIPPVRSAMTSAATRFTRAYSEREQQQLRAVLMSESLPLAR